MSSVSITSVDQKSGAITFSSTSRPSSIFSPVPSISSADTFSYYQYASSASLETIAVDESANNGGRLILKPRNLDPSPKYTEFVSSKEKFLDGTSIIIESSSSTPARSPRSSLSGRLALSLPFLPSGASTLSSTNSAPFMSSPTSSPASHTQSYETLRDLPYIQQYRSALYFSLEDDLDEEPSSIIPSAGGQMESTLEGITTRTSARIFSLPRYSREDTIAGKRLAKAGGVRSKKGSRAGRGGEWMEDTLVGVWTFMKQPSRI